MKLQKFTLLISALMLPVAVLAAPPLADRHVEKSLPCGACHGTDKPQPMVEVEGEKCLQCHPREPLARKFSALGNKNPHENHLGEIECSLCHKGHEPSKAYCANCHKDFEMPMK